MNYKDEDIERLEGNNSQNNGELLKEKQNNTSACQQHETLRKSPKKATSPNSQNISESVVKKGKSDDLSDNHQVSINNSKNNTLDNNCNSSVQGESSHKQSTHNNGITTESNNNSRGNVAKVELSNCQPINESSNGLKKSSTEKKDSNWNNNGCQNHGVDNSSSNLRNNISGSGTSNGQRSNNSTLSYHQTIPLCEQEGQVKMMKLAGLTVLMHRKKGEIIYRLADNMSVNSLSETQREALLREIKTLHDSNAIVTQSQFTQSQETSTTSSQLIINASSSLPQTPTSLPDHPSVISHDTSTSSMRGRPSLAQASKLIQPTTVPISMSTTSINNTATLNTQTASKQLYIPLASRPPSVTTVQSTIPSQTFYPSSSLEDSFYPDGSSSSTRRYTKTGRYAKKRSTDETDSQYTQEYTTQYQHIPTNTSIPISNQMNNQMSVQTSQPIQPIQSVPTPQPTYYTSTTPTTRPIVQYYSAQTPISRGVKRPFQSTGIQRTAEEINHHMDVAQRFEAATKADQIAVLQPDYKTPFRSFQDAVARLLPYHVFEYPDEDMKGNDQTSDLDATKNALRFYKRRKVIYDKYNDLLKTEAERPCSTAYTNLCERLIVEDEKAENMKLKEDCRRLSEQIKSRSQLLFLQQQQLQRLQSSSTQQPKQSELPQRQN